MKKPRLVPLLSLTLAVVAVVFLLGRSSDSPDIEETGAWRPVGPDMAADQDSRVQAPVESARTGSEEQSEERAADAGREESPEQTAHREAMLEASELLEQQTRRLGYFNYDDRAVYASYSLDQLESLLEQGDLRAYPVILDQHAADASQEYLTWVSFRAAIQGSTPAIGMLAHLESSRAQYERLMENDPESRERLLHAQALFKSATELGDPFMGGSAQHQLDHQGYELTEQDLQQIDSLSQRFLETLDQRRQEQGFGPLERASEELKAEYERLGISSSPWDE